MTQTTLGPVQEAATPPPGPDAAAFPACGAAGRPASDALCWPAMTWALFVPCPRDFRRGLTMDCSCLQTRRRRRRLLPPDWGMGHAQGEKDFSVRCTEQLRAGSDAPGWAKSACKRFARPCAMALKNLIGRQMHYCAFLAGYQLGWRLCVEFAHSGGNSSVQSAWSVVRKPLDLSQEDAVLCILCDQRVPFCAPARGTLHE